MMPYNTIEEEEKSLRDLSDRVVKRARPQMLRTAIIGD